MAVLVVAAVALVVVAGFVVVGERAPSTARALEGRVASRVWPGVSFSTAGGTSSCGREARCRRLKHLERSKEWMGEFPAEK